MSPPWILSGNGIDPLVSPVHRKVSGGSFSESPIQLFDFDYTRNPSVLNGLFRIRFTTQARLEIYNDAFVATKTEDQPEINQRMWHEDTGAVDPSPWDYRCREITELFGVTTGWAASSPALGTWFNGGSVHQWGNFPTGIGGLTAIWEIREVIGEAIVAEAAITLRVSA